MKSNTVILSGSSWLGGTGVPIYSNDGTFDSNGNDINYYNGIKTGYRWQCVELINRLYLTKNWISNYWQGNGYEKYDTAPANLAKQANGSITSVNAGDVVVLSGGVGGNGHVAVVNSVSGTTIVTVSQNLMGNNPYRNFTWDATTKKISSGWSGYATIGIVHAPAGTTGNQDTDGDGVLNTADACPSVAGPAWKNGCPAQYALTDGGMASGDFDNDGNQDVAIGSPSEDSTIGGVNQADAGMVNIIYGSASGPNSARQNRLMQAGVTGPDVVTLAVGSIEVRDVVGATLVAGDFNGDSYDDLAIGAPGESLNSQDEAGMIHIVYGSINGLSTTSAQQVLTQNGLTGSGIVNLSGSIEAGDFVGAEMAAGDIDGDGFADLVIGAPGEDIGVNGVNQVDAGLVHIAYGSASGFSTRQNTVTQAGYTGSGVINTSGSIEPNDYYGASLATSDFNKDGKADIVIGAPSEDVGSTIDAGFVSLLYGSATGPVAATQKSFTQTGYSAPDNVPLQLTLADTNDYLGASIATGDINGDTYPDLVISSPGEDTNAFNTGNPSAGLVHVIYNSAGSFTTSSTQQLFVQNGLAGTGIVNTAVGSIEPNDMFGSALAIGDIDGDGFADLVVGAPGEALGVSGVDNPYAGLVHVAFGSSSGIGSRQQTLAQGGASDPNILPLVGSIETNDFVGADLLVADLDGNGKQDLLTSAVGEDISTPTAQSEAGLVDLSYGGVGGFSNLQYSFTQTGWDSQTNIQLLGDVEAGDNFGGGQPTRLLW